MVLEYEYTYLINTKFLINASTVSVFINYPFLITPLGYGIRNAFRNFVYSALHAFPVLFSSVSCSELGDSVQIQKFVSSLFS